jgi:hypothetical protein
VARLAVGVLGIAYLLLLAFPQPLFAHTLAYGNFTVYARAPIDSRMTAVLDGVESRLRTAGIESRAVRPRIFLTGSSRFYRAIRLGVGQNSFGNGFGALPTRNVFINRHDAAQDRVFREAASHSSRGLTGVIAHEVTHLAVRQRVGYWRNLRLPAWKTEGYAEYVAGESTLPFETGLRLWQASPRDGTGYQYFRYFQIVKHLLERKQVSVDDLFARDFDLQALSDEVLQALSAPAGRGR